MRPLFRQRRMFSLPRSEGLSASPPVRLGAQRCGWQFCQKNGGSYERSADQIGQCCKEAFQRTCHLRVSSRDLTGRR